MLIDGAQGRVAARIPRGEGKEEAEQALLIVIKRSLALGWCEVQIPGNDYGEIDLTKKLFGEGKIKLRIYDAVSGPGLSSTDAGIHAFPTSWTRAAMRILARASAW